MLVELDNNQKKILYVFTFFALLAGLILLKNYIMLVVIAAILAILFNPIHDYFLRKGVNKGTASFYTFMISVLFIIIPVIFVLIITFHQINELLSTISNETYSIDVNNIGNYIVDTINRLFKNLGTDYRISLDQFLSTVSSVIEKIGRAIISGVYSTFTGLFGFITAGIIYIYVFMSMLNNKNKILEVIKMLNPLGDKVTEIYIQKVNAMTKATVRGQFIIAFMQGLASALVITLVSGGQLFYFYLLLLTVMSVIPLGAGIITIPLGIFMMLTGNVWQGIVVIANHLLLVTNIDNVMRPRLVPKNARLDSALMILSVFAGLALFGFFGIVIGPIIMILVVTTIQIYIEVFYKTESLDKSKNKKSKSIFSYAEKILNKF